MGLTFNAFMHITSALVSRFSERKRAKANPFNVNLLRVHFLCVFSINAFCAMEYFSRLHSKLLLWTFIEKFAQVSYFFFSLTRPSIHSVFVSLFRPLCIGRLSFGSVVVRCGATALSRFACKCKCPLIFPFCQYRPLKSRANR